MNNKFVKYFFTLFCIGISFQSNAQVNDAGLWASINLEKKINKNFSVALSEEFRFNENFSELGSYFTEISGEYRVKKYLFLSAGYRFTNRRRVDDSYSKRHRYMVNVNLKNKFGKISANLRLRYQSQYSDVQSSETGSVPDNYLRTKLTFKYVTDTKLTPFIAGESFFHLNHPEGTLFNNYRVSFGCEYEYSKRSTFDLGYLIDKEINVNDPWTRYVITVSWNYKI